MQPRELTIEGLTSFRERTMLDFTDVSLFALVGPTGAGKSSVIDAMTLALYGRVPRLHANEIAPVIATQASECTVGLTFTVRGRLHRAVRTVRRTKTGASTLEAALERLDEDGQVITVLAGTADDVTVEVERLIGLTFGEFTRAVVLPQDEFSRVLRAQPKERQALLSRLLGVGIYDRVKQRAGAHAKRAQERAEQTSHQIHQLGAVGPDRVEELGQQVVSLDALVDRLAIDTETLQVIRDEFRDASAAAREATDRLDRLAAVEPPPDAVAEHADRLMVAGTTIDKARAALEVVEKRLVDAEESQPKPEELERLASVVTLHGRTPERASAVQQACDALTAACTEIEQVTIGLGRAQAEADQAVQAQAVAHRGHAAVQAIDGLQVGDDCPVCASTLPADAPAFLAASDDDTDATRAAADRLTTATRRVGTLEAQKKRAQADVAGAQTAVDRAEKALVDHTAALAGQPTEAEATASISQARQVQHQIAGHRKEARDARDDLDSATRERDRIREQAAGLSARLDRLRLSVAPMGPPDISGDVVVDWTALHAWCTAKVPEARSATETANDAVTRCSDRGTALRDQMDRTCADAGVPPGDNDPKDRAVQHRADLSAERDKQAKLLEMAAGLRADEADAREQAAVGDALAKLLRTDQFQRWLLDEATRALVSGASDQLRSLSSGRYELTLDSGNGSIQVADLSSAGAPRSVRTLSGGETFLASLALALSLAEQIAVSATGSVALESLFIDEGFGALDPETLDIAAGAIEQLGAGDRTVGVVTHVAEMAERLPTRFVVERTASGSRVDRVDL